MLNNLLKPILESLPENNWLERLWMVSKVDFWKRYYNNKLGIVWAFLNPLLHFLIYYFFFTVVYQNKVEGFAFYLFSGMLFWQFFSEGTSQGISIYHTKIHLIQSIQIHKFDLNLASCLTAFYAFIFNFCVFLLIQMLFGPDFSWYILYLPLLMLNVFLIVLGVGSLLSALYLYVKDITHFWSIIIRAGFFTHPILFPKELILEHAPIAIYISPLVGILINLREVVVYAKPPDLGIMAFDLIYGIILAAIGYFVSQKVSYKVLEKL